MSDNSSNNKRIAKNTLLLYVRMLFTMLVGLYTSRVVLQVLGIEDYGTYQVVGGVVGLLAFINNTLSQGTSRFLLFEMGGGDLKSISRLFSTLLNAHVCLALIIILLAETIGLWFVYHKLLLPDDRVGPAVLTYHLSVITSFFTLTQVPYAAAIKSHERFDIYAYTSLFDVTAKLAIVYLLMISPIDRLSFYAIMLCVESVGMTLFLRFFCKRHFEETRYQFIFDVVLLKKVIGYCGWNLFSNVSSVLNTHGLYILINMFFNAGIVTSIAVATTIKDAANSFIENFRSAAIPQMVTSYASGNHARSKLLLLSTTKYSYFLLLALGLPIFLTAKELFRLWLGFVPDYADTFLRYIIIVSVFMLFNSCLFTTQDIVGKIKRYSISFPTMMFFNIMAIYVSFRSGSTPVAYVRVLLVTYVIMAVIIQPILVVKQTYYTYREIFKTYWQCLYVTIPAIIIPIIAYVYMPAVNDLLRLLLLLLISFMSVILCVWFFGIDRETRCKLEGWLRLKFK